MTEQAAGSKREEILATADVTLSFQGIDFPATEEHALFDKTDQRRIVKDLHALDVFHTVRKEPTDEYLASLLLAVDNVRHVCEQAQVEVPDWYRDKYLLSRETPGFSCIVS